MEGLTAGVLAAVPELACMDETPQDARWHAEGSVLTHTRLVVAGAREIAGREELEAASRRALLLAAALHDLGKVWRTREVDGALVSPGHALAGHDRLALAGLDTPLGGEPGVFLTALRLIGSHHAFGRLGEVPEWGVPLLAAQAPLGLLAALMEADELGRVSESSRGDQAAWLRLCAEELRVSVWTEVDRPVLTGDPRDPAWLGSHGLGGGPRAALLLETQALAGQLGLDDWQTRRFLASASRDWEMVRAGRVWSGPEELLRRWQGGEARRPNGTFTLLVGLPGSGKSTHAADLAAQGARVISLDDLRRQRGLGASETGAALQAARQALREELAAGGHVVWDATSLRRDLRAPLLRLARDYGALTVIRAQWVSPALAWSRNALRPEARRVPRVTWEAMARGAQWPLGAEADEVWWEGADSWRR